MTENSKVVLSLEEKRSLLKRKEKILAEKERKMSERQLINIGKLASKAQINHLDDQALLGAFLEIASHLTNNSKLQSWEEQAKKHLNSKSEIGDPLAIKFKEQPNKDIVNLLKNAKFKWNRFRREYYGRGNRSEMAKILKNVDCKIEVVE